MTPREAFDEIERLTRENEQISQTENGHWRMAYLKQEAENERLREALEWCSGSDDFNEGGKAREGWLKLCRPLLEGTQECPNCHNANKYGDYEGPSCPVCEGTGYVRAALAASVSPNNPRLRSGSQQRDGADEGKEGPNVSKEEK